MLFYRGKKKKVLTSLLNHEGLVGKGCIVLTGKKKEILWSGTKCGRERDRGSGSVRSWKIFLHEEEPTFGLW